jgi:hypothetical protein
MQSAFTAAYTGRSTATIEEFAAQVQSNRLIAKANLMTARASVTSTKAL